ncbi:serine protein kinase RIO [Oryzihumus sp.]|uniref:serine protein kinase RIO n=1 Tax=Oryzihumus sp. TaxID=1968903 RepID=UPI002ED9140E
MSDNTPGELTALPSDLFPGTGFGVDTTSDDPPEGDRWSTWDVALHGPHPRPDWVITALAAVDADLGVLKTGKEADVHVVRRWVPGTDEAITLAAKRYRSHDRRMFHRDAGYLEGRRVRRSREMRAMARRTSFGKEVISQQWASAEFGALGRLWTLGLPVPYPVQLTDEELLMEFVGLGVEAAPRLAQARPAPDLLADLFEQCRDAMATLAAEGWAHGDLSPYNVLLHEDRLVIIDWPQIVDVVGNPHGADFLQRDVHNMCRWFTSRGLEVDEEAMFGDLMACVYSRW